MDPDDETLDVDDPPSLPAAAEEFFARERGWNRLLRASGLVTDAEITEKLHRISRE